MLAVLEELLRIEEELGAASADAYRRHLAEDAVVVVPGAVLDRPQCIAAVEASPAWDERAITEAQVLPLGPDCVALTYRWRSRRRGAVYSARMTSVYVREGGVWRLMLHQQTPDPG